MALLNTRLVYAPFEYDQAYNYWERQQQAHWLHLEVSLASDINDWKINLTENEKYIIGSTLKGFTQAEVIIEDYWSNKVANWFKKPEIQMMANTFAAFESIHAVSYAYLNQSLGLENFDAFLHEPSAKAKIDRLINIKGKSKHDIAKSLAIFSAFNEGVNLFSSFAILFNFSRFNKMKGIGQIIAFSIRDESLHSEAGCWLFRTFIKEYPEVWTDEFKKELYEAARLTVALEDDFINKTFENGDLEDLTKEDLMQYIRYRCNTKLQDLGLKSNWKNIDKSIIEKMMWFDVLSSGVEHSDFFSSRVSDYSKSSVNWDSVFAVTK
jgi:ribonucleoside-diphosphate reductase beta chain